MGTTSSDLRLANGIQHHDPALAIWTMILLSVVSAAAGLIPAQRASRIDPILGYARNERGQTRPLCPEL